MRTLSQSLALALIAIAVLPAAAVAQNRNFELEWLRNAGARFTGVDEQDLAGLSISSAGDVNGDGFDDILVGAPEDPNFSPSTVGGKVYLIYGGLDFDGDFDLASADVIFEGDDEADQAGFSVSSAGDFNNDTFDDLLIGARTADASAGDTGKVYLVYGSASLASSIDLGTLGSGGVTFEGESLSDRVGSSVAGVGDVNDDGFDDVLMSADSAGPTLNLQGRVYLVYGGGSISGTIALSTLGSGGMTMDGIDIQDKAGAVVAAAGNVNGDAFDDFIIAAEQANPDSHNNAGQMYIIYGSDSLPTSMSLSAADVAVNGELSGDFLGSWIAGGGDVNDDGFDDVIATSDIWPPGGDNNGRVYLIYGSASLASTIEIASLGAGGVTFTGAEADDNAGVSAAIGGDMNKDGYDDILIGAHNSDTTASNAGDAYLVYGGPTLPSSYSLASVDAGGSVLNGIAVNDRAGQSTAFAGDVDGDGFDDMLIGARAADPNGDTSAGEVYLLKGTSYFFQAAGPVAEGGTLEFRAQGRPNQAFLTFLALSAFNPPLPTDAGLWFLEPPILSIFQLAFASNGAMDLSLGVPVSSPSAVGLTVHLQNFINPLSLGHDVSYLLTFTIE